MNAQQQLMHYFQNSSEVFQLLTRTCHQEIRQIVSTFQITLNNGGTIYFCGNGGSAADSQHLAAEFVVRFAENREALPAVALTTDTSVLTAGANDLGYDTVFERQVEAHVGADDLLVAISTSGNSENVLQAAKKALEQKATVVAFTGKDGGSLKHHCDITLQVPSDTTSHIQEAHIAVGHFLCKQVEEQMIDDDA